ncbi:hypothetical protein BESB_082030 [Besnoitia besnoiti]|uniref:SRS domain-containing protein n=1 Tax=Besnoitia besnoiti TaxID=94643 RepID=A0A2A9M733_BESBE|nr:hypothetical protein BESB_082030 [Besnoitia besnoiti]PFH33004.1 hypothetical protein BESB_082030 [Besnoitia besnoiti]
MSAAPRLARISPSPDSLISSFLAFLAFATIWLALSWRSPALVIASEDAGGCTAEHDFTLIFDGEDVQKSFNCPEGWKLTPAATTSAFHGGHSVVDLEGLVPGAKLEPSEFGYTLTLPGDSPRETRTWYYTCTAPADGDSSATDKGPPESSELESNTHSPEEEKEQTEDTSSSTTPNQGTHGTGGGGSVSPGGKPSPGTPEVPGNGDTTGSHNEQNDNLPGSDHVREDGVLNGVGAGHHSTGQEPPLEDSKPDLAPGPAAAQQSSDGKLNAQESRKESAGSVAAAASFSLRSAVPLSVQGSATPPLGAKRTTCVVTVHVFPSPMIECQAGETKTATVSTLNAPVNFKCGDGLTLQPKGTDRVYDNADGRCESEAPLTALIHGSLSSSTVASEKAGELTHYVLKIDELPSKQQELCYKCTASPKVMKEAEHDPEVSKECVVKIAVASETAPVSQPPSFLLLSAVVGLLARLR